MRSGFVSILGNPNVGKSTLLNRLVGAKLAGISRKPGTTRQMVRGIRSESRGQIVFLDTPGLQRAKDLLTRSMMSQTARSLGDVDVIYFMTEPKISKSRGIDILKDFKLPKVPVFCLINKVDQVDKPELLPVIDYYQKQYPFQEIVPISALTGDQLDHLLMNTYQVLPEHEPFFPTDVSSDQAERFIVSEMIREKVFRFTDEEVPYACFVEIETFQEAETLTRIEAVIYVERDSQKGILIGRQGLKLKKIGTEARKDIERFLTAKVFLKLWVKVQTNWRKDSAAIRKLGLGS